MKSYLSSNVPSTSPPRGAGRSWHAISPHTGAEELSPCFRKFKPLEAKRCSVTFFGSRSVFPGSRATGGGGASRRRGGGC